MQGRIQVKYENDVFNLDITADQISEKLSIESTYNITYPVNVADKFVDVLNLANDGIFGLGTDESSVVYQLYNQSIISQPIYSLSFLNEPLLVLDKPDFLELSLVIETQQTISYKDPLKIDFFEFGAYVPKPETSPVEFNSISSYITGPFEALEAVFKELVNEGCHYEEELLMCECGNTDYSSFTFGIQGENFTIGPEYYLIQVISI